VAITLMTATASLYILVSLHAYAFRVWPGGYNP
jgi:hypothetical protein